MSPLSIALLVGLLTGAALTAALRRRTSAAIPTPAHDHRQLPRLPWDAFVRLVLQAMQGRGYRAVLDPGTQADGAGEVADLLLARGGRRTLLACRAGQSGVVAADGLLGLSRAATLRGADDVLLVTAGRFDEEAFRIARQQRIELIDGETLWPEVRPYVARPQHADAVAATSMPARGIAVAWSIAALCGLLAWAIARNLPPADATPADAALGIPQPGDTPAIATPAPAAAPVSRSDTIPTDPAALAQRRSQTARDVAALEGVHAATWISDSTLDIQLATEDADPGPALCRVMERYPELAASRLQLQAPAGSTRLVRYRQCRRF